MANFRDYYYCMHCDRPLRLGKETQRISEGYGDNRRTWIECLVCVSKCHEPSKSFLSIAVLLFLSFMWFTGPARSYSDPIGLIPIGLMVAIIIRRFWDSHRYKPIYDRWVKKHGSNSEVWPKNKFKFDLWPNHVYHDPEATEKMLQTAVCSACGKPCSDYNVCVISEGKPIHKACLYSPHEL